MNQVKITKLCNIEIGKTPSRSDLTFWGKGVNWVSIRDMKEKYIYDTNEEITMKAINETGIKLVPQNTVIMSFKLSVGKVAITGKDMYTNEAIAAFHILDEKMLYYKYLYYALQTLRLSDNTDRAVMGLTLNKQKLKQLSIPLPPLQTQKKIVEVLDKAQELIDARKQQIKLLDDLIQSVFYDMFGDPVTNPKGWVIKSIEQISTMKSGGTPSRSKPEYFCGTIPWITTTALGDRYIDESYASEYITKEAIKNSATKIIPRHSLIIGVRVGVGKVSINNCDICTNQDIVSLTEITSEISLDFLWYQIKTYHKMLMNRKRGATIQGITSKVLKKLNIIVPPIDLQNQFAKKVQKIESQKELMQQSLTEMENNFNSLMQKAFKGELFTA